VFLFVDELQQLHELGAGLAWMCTGRLVWSELVVVADPLTAQPCILAADLSEIHSDTGDKRSPQRHRSAAARERQHRARVGPGQTTVGIPSLEHSQRILSYIRGWPFVDTELTSLCTCTWVPQLAADLSAAANKCNQGRMDGGHRRHNKLKTLREVVRHITSTALTVIWISWHYQPQPARK